MPSRIDSSGAYADYGVRDEALHSHLWRECVFAISTSYRHSPDRMMNHASGSWRPASNNTAAKWSLLDGYPAARHQASANLIFLDDKPTFQANACTMSLWARWLGTSGTKYTAMILGNSGSASSTRLGVDTSGNWEFYFRDATTLVSATSVAAASDTWVHLCATRSRANNIAEFFIDGVKYGEYSGTTTGSEYGAIRVGIGLTSTSVSDSWDGYLDGAMWHNRVLSLDEIQLLASDRLIAYQRRKSAPRKFFGMQETVPVTVTVPVATCSATAVLPTVRSPYTVTVPVVTAAATAVLPATTTTYTATVPVATAAATAVAPATKSPYVVSMPVATAAATAVAPSTKATYTVTVPVATATCVAVNPTMATVVDPGIAIAEATAIAPTARASYTVTVPVATAAATAVLPKTNITVTVPVATCSCTASYTVGGNHITDELGTDTLDEFDLPIEDENTSVPGTITVVVPVAICHCVAIPGQTVAGLETDFYCDYEAWAATANAGMALTANYQTPTYTTWVRRVDTPSRGVQLK